MILSGNTKFISKSTGTSKANKPFYMAKFLDDDNDAFFSIFVDETLFQLFEDVKRGDTMRLTLNLTPGNKYFSLIDAEMSN